MWHPEPYIIDVTLWTLYHWCDTLNPTSCWTLHEPYILGDSGDEKEEKTKEGCAVWFDHILLFCIVLNFLFIYWCKRGWDANHCGVCCAGVCSFESEYVCACGAWLRLSAGVTEKNDACFNTWQHAAAHCNSDVHADSVWRRREAWCNLGVYVL